MRVLVGVLCALVLVARATSVGDGRLLRTFGVFSSQPMTVDEAEDAGYTALGGCVEGAGVMYAPPSGVTKGNSFFLVFSAGGQISGFGVRLFGDDSLPEALQQFWMPASSSSSSSSDGGWTLTVFTRDPTQLCSGKTWAQPLGDRVNIAGVLNVPLTMAQAEAAGWLQGDCINKMGIHHSFDLNAFGRSTWNSSSLVPVQPMYDAHNGTINAVLFNVADLQRTEPLGDWEGPFINSLVCKNWCPNTGCTWPGVNVWSTMHWLFVNPASISCAGAKCVL